MHSMQRVLDLRRNTILPQSWHPVTQGKGPPPTRQLTKSKTWPLCSTFPASPPPTLKPDALEKKKKLKVLVTQPFSTLCNPMYCSLPRSPVHGILQARTIEWVDIPFSKGSSQPRDWTRVPYIAGRFPRYQGSPYPSLPFSNISICGRYLLLPVFKFFF